MAQPNDKQPGVLRSLDWWTIGIYLMLLAFGWISVCGATYTFGETDIFSFDSNSGKQLVWIGTAVVLGLFILLLDDRFFDTFAYVLYGALILLLIATIFNPHEIKAPDRGLFWDRCACNLPSLPSLPRRYASPNS